ncbi:MAG: hypothetical protein CVT62_05435 [Actinobacteria bacterium HGW-Actinobacteria-2]|nr:MAG: hypothetical protein CVT62_05435 [Actinobacteria bacterium HGW-Actinobacteria-2]
MGFRKRLTAAMSTQTKITVDLKPKHANRQEGFVVGIGEKWCLLAATMDGGYFDGYQAFRVKDVARIRRDKSFQPTFSRTQPEWPPSPPPVDLDSTVGLVSSLAAFSPLIGIEMAADRDRCGSAPCTSPNPSGSGFTRWDPIDPGTTRPGAPGLGRSPTSAAATTI